MGCGYHLEPWWLHTQSPQVRAPVQLSSKLLSMVAGSCGLMGRPKGVRSFFGVSHEKPGLWALGVLEQQVSASHQLCLKRGRGSSQGGVDPGGLEWRHWPRPDSRAGEGKQDVHGAHCGSRGLEGTADRSLVTFPGSERTR